MISTFSVLVWFDVFEIAPPLSWIGPDSADELMNVSRDFQKLADGVGQGKGQLSPQEQAQRHVPL